MKTSRNYPVYKVNKHAEGLLVGGHPWVYENDILGSPEAEPENGTLAGRLLMASPERISLWQQKYVTMKNQMFSNRLKAA